MVPISISRTAAAADPHLVWNAFVKLCFSGPVDYTATQRVAHMAFLYDAEVQNGGHYQYFENRGLTAARETILALDLLGADRQKDILEGAIRKYEEVNPNEHEAESLQEFSDGALEGNYGDFDSRYYDCKPPLEDLLKTWLDSHFADFITWTE